MKLKETLAHLLEKNDMSVAQLARKASVPKQNIHNWLSGMKAKDIEQIKRVADIFNISMDELLFGKEQSPIAYAQAESNDEWLEGIYEIRLRKVVKP